MNGEDQRHRIRHGILFAAIAAISLAFTNVLTPLIYDAGGNTVSLLFLRAMFTTFAVAVLLVATGRMKKLPLRQELYCWFSGFSFMFAGIGLLGAFAIIPVSRAVLVLYLFPIFTILLDSLVRRSLPNIKTILLLLVALLGLSLVLEVRQGFELSRGVVLAAMAAFSVAVTFVWNNHKLAQVDPEQITFRMFLVSFILFGVWLAATGGFAIPAQWAGLSYLGVVLAAFTIAFLLMFRASQMAGSVRISMILNLEPVITIAMSVALFSEIMSPLQYTGAALVLAAVALSHFHHGDRD